MQRLWALALLLPGVALADPCTGALPARAGETFSGQVRYIVDGDGLCVGRSANRATWIEVRLADFDAPELRGPRGPEAKRALEGLAMGRAVSCETRRGRSGRVQNHDRVFAVCRVNGRALGQALRAAGVREGGN